MNEHLKKCMSLRIEKTIENLKKNNMEGYYLETKEEVIPFLEKMIAPGASVSLGGSVTLSECNVPEFLKSGKYNYLDRYEEGLTRDQIEEVFHKALLADVYISSSNAVTENGELYNVDGNSNRVAAILYGPKEVILICGINKLVTDLDGAVERMKTVAAPSNALRLSCDTYCSKTGRCAGLNGNMVAGCNCEDRICANYTVCARQRKVGRIKVVIVGESLGY